MEKLLIVDDEAPIRKLLKQLLEKRNYHCTTAADAAEAREHLADQRFDLVISDIYMGKESGIELAKHIKATYENTGVIIASTLSDPQKIKEVLNVGVYGYIVKPIDRNNLYINVDNALRRLILERNEKKRRQNLENKVIERSAEAAASERRFRDLVEGSIQGIMIYNDTGCAFVNQAFAEIFGYSEEEIKTMEELRLLVAPEDRDRLSQFHRDWILGRETRSQDEFIGLRKDGSRIWVKNRVRLVEWDGKPSIQSTVTDITQRKQSEALLKKSEASLKTILASVLTGVLVIDSETHLIVDANPCAINLIGVPKNQIIGHTCHQFVCPAEKNNCPVTDLEQDIDHAERILITASGERIPILKTVKQTELNGRPYLIESFIDLREQKEAEKAQKEQLHFLSELVNNIPYPFGFKDREGKYQIWNAAFEEFSGIKAEQALGNTIYDLLPFDRARQVDEQETILYKNPPTLNYKAQLHDIQGQTKYMDVTKKLYCDQDGNIAGIITLMVDETAKNHMEVQLRHAQKLESIGQLAAGIAHEINTPTQYVGDNTRFLSDAFEDIKSVLESYSALIEAVKDDDRYRSMVEKLEEALEDADLEYLEEEIPVAIEQSLEGVDRVTTIVRSMKEFSHPGEENKTLININKSIESTITVARNEWKYLAEVTTELDQTIPPVPCLPGELNQVFLNIIVNAAHAMENRTFDNSDRGSIHITTKSNGQFVNITIRDNGCGIPKEIQNRIFDPFFTTKEVGKGTGQGLSIAHTVIAENHGGTITCDSEEGVGTVFTIQLPLNDTPPEEATS